MHSLLQDVSPSIRIASLALSDGIREQGAIHVNWYGSVLELSNPFYPEEKCLNFREARKTMWTLSSLWTTRTRPYLFDISQDVGFPPCPHRSSSLTKRKNEEHNDPDQLPPNQIAPPAQPSLTGQGCSYLPSDRRKLSGLRCRDRLAALSTDLIEKR